MHLFDCTNFESIILKIILFFNTKIIFEILIDSETYYHLLSLSSYTLYTNKLN